MRGAGRGRSGVNATPLQQSVWEGSTPWHEAWGLSLNAQTPCLILLKLLNKAAVHIGVLLHTLTMYAVIASYRRECKLVPKVLGST